MMINVYQYRKCEKNRVKDTNSADFFVKYWLVFPGSAYNYRISRNNQFVTTNSSWKHIHKHIWLRKVAWDL